jgi:hypothetical protein
MKQIYLLFLTTILLPSMAISNTIFDKQLDNGMILKFNYALEKNQHSWIVELSTFDTTYMLEKFIYEEDSLPIRLTPDVWQETIYQLFSLMDVILLSNNHILILYDQFGFIHCKEYNVNTYQLCTIFPIKKYKLSFLHGYNSSYGKMLQIDNMIYISSSYHTLTPFGENFLRFSLSDKKVEKITFKDTDFLILASNSFFSKNEINESELKEQLKKIVQKKYGHDKSFVYIGYLNNVLDATSSSEVVCCFLYIDNQLNLYRFDNNKKRWIIGDFIMSEIKDQ